MFSRPLVGHSALPARGRQHPQSLPKSKVQDANTQTEFHEILHHRLNPLQRMIYSNAGNSITGIYGWVELNACRLKLFNLHAFYSNKYGSTTLKPSGSIKSSLQSNTRVDKFLD